MKKKYNVAILVILLVLIIDQWLKIWVKLNIPYGDGYDILGLSWAKIHFVENPGMAFGLSFGGTTGKLVLSSFRILMVGVLIYILRKMIKSGESLGLIVSFSLIIAGAIGNIIDSIFYGLIFSSNFHGGLAEFLPENGGYAPILQGRVVDMFYFPLIDTTFPDWLPIWGGQRFQFFRPIFNVADSAITIGVALLLLFHRKFFKQDPKKKTSRSLSSIDPSTDV